MEASRPSGETPARRSTFLRLRPGHLIAAAAALLLLLVMALDWYSTAEGEEARRIERIQKSGEEVTGAEAQEAARRIEEDASIVAEQNEQNAWQADRAIDRILLLVLLAAVALALAAAALRAAGRRYEPPLTPVMLAAGAAAVGALLVTYRMIQEPGLDVGSEIQAGPPLALVALGLLALGAALAARSEDRESEAPASGQPVGQPG